MAFDVALVLQIESVFIGKVVPVGVIAVVGESHVVDVALLHEHDLVQHLFARDGMSCGGIGLVPVHTFQFHRFAVHIEIASCQVELILLGLCVAYLHRTYAKVGAGAIQQTALLVPQRGHHDIPPWLLGTPQAWVLDIDDTIGGNVFRRGYHGLRLVGIQFYGIHFVVDGVCGSLLAQRTHFYVGLHCGLIGVEAQSPDC